MITSGVSEFNPGEIIPCPTVTLTQAIAFYMFRIFGAEFLITGNYQEDCEGTTSIKEANEIARKYASHGCRITTIQVTL